MGESFHPRFVGRRNGDTRWMRRILLGLAAGAAGTAAMTAVQELLPRLRGDQAGGEEEEPAPAQAARKVLRAVGLDPPASWTPYLTQAAHWSYGLGWGAVYGALRRGQGNPVLAGLSFGAGVWAASYAQLVPLGIYEPPWRYAPQELAEDLSYHAVYGLGVAGAYAVLTR
jgi:hypothetical protein